MSDDNNLYEILEEIRYLNEIDIEEFKLRLLEISNSHSDGINFRCAYDGEANMTPLLCACLHGHWEFVKWLIQQGADIKAQSIYGNSCLHLAIKADVPLNEFHYLINNGADINCVDDRLDSALHVAAMGYTELLQFIVTLVADINVQNEDGNTSLHNAVENEYIDCVKVLLDHNADANIANNEGNTVLDLIKKSNNENLNSLFN